MPPVTTNTVGPLHHLRFEVTGSVAHITLNHAPYNLLTVPMMREIATVIESLNNRSDVKCVLLDSALKVFSYGISREDSRPDRVFHTLEAFNGIFQAIIETSKPLIVAVDGQAVGTGCELVAFGDMILATPRAQFAQPEVKLGIFPPFASVLLPAVIGPKRTYEMILTGEPLTALEAKELGFVNRVVPEEDLKQAVDDVLNRIVQFSGPVLEMTKKVVSSTMGLPVRDAIRKSQDLYLNQLMALEDAQEGIRAVAENRRPVWRNR